MGIFKKLFSKPQRVEISVDPKVLEDAIYAAVKRIDEDREARALEQYKKDELTQRLQDYLKVLFYVFSLVGAFFCLVFTLSCFSISWSPFRRLDSFALGWKIVVAILSASSTAFFFSFARLVGKEKDRHFVISYFSAIIAILALIVALVKR